MKRIFLSMSLVLAVIVSRAQEVTTNITNDWGTGYSSNVDITPNNDLVAWEVQLRLNGVITSSWGGNFNIVSVDSFTVVIVTPDVSNPWNANISAGQTKSFGFNSTEVSGWTGLPPTVTIQSYNLVQAPGTAGAESNSQYWQETGNKVSLNPSYTNIGIGVADPTEKLEVDGNVKADGIILINGAQDGYILTTDAQGNSSWQQPLVSTNGQNESQIDGDARVTGELKVGTNSLILSSTTTGSVNNNIYASDADLVLQDNSIPGVVGGPHNTVINPNGGNVGIGTVAVPNRTLVIDGNGGAGPLEVRNNGYALYSSNSANNTSFQCGGFSVSRARGTVDVPQNVVAGDRLMSFSVNTFANGAYRTNAAIEYRAGSSIGANSYPAYMTFQTVGENQSTRLERMRLSPDGELGIGTSNPQAMLDVNGTIHAGGNSIVLTNTGAASYIHSNDAALIIQDNGFGGVTGGPHNTLINPNGGNVAIGNVTPTAQLSLGGEFHITSTVNSPGAYVQHIVTEDAADIKAFAIGNTSGSTFADEFVIYGDGRVHIGDVNALGNGSGFPFFVSGDKLAVDGNIRCEELKVEMSDDWADYVFEDEYALMPLDKVEAYVQKHKHLPNVKSAADVMKEGLSVGEMTKMQMEKIEELTLYVLQLKHEIELLKSNSKENR